LATPRTTGCCLARPWSFTTAVRDDTFRSSCGRTFRRSVVLPFAADQFFWAQQSRQRGIAPATGSVDNVTTATLSRAILAARTAEMREQASAVGEKMRAENGLAAAVGQIHALMAS